jgi:hypothetical protein
MDVAPPIKPQYGPSLVELLRGRLSPGARRALAIVAAVALVGGIAAWILAPGDFRYVHEGDPVFNLRWREGGRLKQVDPPPGTLLRLEARRSGRVVQSFSVRPLRLPPYEGSVTAALPMVASDGARQLAGEYTRFTRTDEGKARINDAPGYQFAFEAKEGDRMVLGRQVYLLDPEGDGRDGVLLTMLQRPGGAVTGPQDVGAVGGLRIPYRSFRFGADWPS